MSREKMTVTWTRFVTRPATAEDIENGYEAKIGESIEAEDDIELPGKYEVCDRCEGRATHTNPSIDGNGITSSEWAEWDDEDKETYLSGGYDVCCHKCNGKRVVLVVDESTCDKELFKQYDEYMDQKAKDDYADARMRYMESGGYDY